MAHRPERTDGTLKDTTNRDAETRGRGLSGLISCWRVQAIVAGLVHSFAMAVAFPPMGTWVLAFVAVLPLAWAAEQGSARPIRTGFWVGLGVLPLWLFELAWLTNVTLLGYPLLSGALALFAGLFVWAMGRVRVRWPRIPMSASAGLIWASLEFLRGEVVLSGFPWLLAGQPLIDIPLGLAASAFGVYFLSALVASWGAFIADMLGGVEVVFKAVVAPVVFTLLATLGGLFGGVGPEAGPKLVIAAVQTNVPQDNKIEWTLGRRLEDWIRFEELIDEAADMEPDVIVLPETMFPGLTVNPAGIAEEVAAGRPWDVELPDGDVVQVPTTWFYDRLLMKQTAIGVPVMIGVIGFDGLRIEEDASGEIDYDFDARFNSVRVVDGGAVRDARYDKMFLTPFGEVMPVISRWEWLEDQLVAIGARGMSFDLTAGVKPMRFRLQADEGEVAVATPICFEATAADVCRKLVFDGGTRRAGLMINLTNDGWFSWWDGGRQQHEFVSRWRCVELGTPLVANTGISGAFDARGKSLTKGLDPQEAGVLRVLVQATGQIESEDGRSGGGATAYVRWGHWTPLVLLGGGLGLILGSLIRRGSPIADEKDVVGPVEA